MAITGFDWDSGNTAKCQRHGVSVSEIEALFARPIVLLPDEAHSITETRLKAIGMTDAGRHVFLIFTIREREGAQYIRPVSARYMHRKEIESYEEDNPPLQER